MQQPMPFDTSVYYSYVAKNLLTNLGDKALSYAGEALRKMKAIGDDEGLDIWVNIHEHLTIQSSAQNKPDNVTLH